jgi:hypothetical protein
VSTSDEEIKPLDGASPFSSVDPATDSIRVDTAAVDDASARSDSSVAGEPEPAPVLRSIPDTAIRHWKSSHDFDYANDPSLWKKNPKEEDNLLQRFFDSAVFHWLIYIVLGGMLLFVLYKIISENNLRFFYRKPARARETASEEAALPEEDLDQLLRQAVEGKEYRMATRYLYLKTLRHLDSLDWIRWHGQSTDEEYVRQMHARPEGERFRWLTTAYERVWYGKFSLDEHQFSRLSQYFQAFHNDVRHPHHS